MERVIAGVTAAHRATYRFDYEVGYDPVVNDREASAAVQRAIVAELGEEALVEVPPVMGGEDFSAYGAVAPARLLLGRHGQRGARDVVPAPPSRASTSTRRRCATASPSSPAPRSTRFASERARGGEGTPAIVAAERAGIAFTVHEYAHDPKAASYGLEAAEKLGVDPARVFKTLVADVDGRAHRRRRAGRGAARPQALGKRAAMADPKLAERTTGYVAGGISPLGQRKRLPTVLDESALGFETIHVSAGRRGLEIELAPADLLASHGRAARRHRRAAVKPVSRPAT